MNRKIVDYIFVDYRHTDLRYVNEGGSTEYDPDAYMKSLISDGYQPYGNPVQSETHYAQAMVKYED